MVEHSLASSPWRRPPCSNFCQTTIPIVALQLNIKYIMCEHFDLQLHRMMPINECQVPAEYTAKAFVFLHNGPKSFIKHCMKKIELSKDVQYVCLCNVICFNLSFIWGETLVTYLNSATYVTYTHVQICCTKLIQHILCWCRQDLSSFEIAFILKVWKENLHFW